MYPFWPTIVEPLLKAQQPKVIVEVGSEAGRNLWNLLRFAAANNAVVHAIDPKPLFDAAQWTREHNGRLIVHADTSLNVLPTLEEYDTLFIDGDHNWYTVYHELKAVEKRFGEIGAPLPLILLHDIGWPWGRRDLYYDPASIPPEFRQPYLEPEPPKGPTGYHADFCKAIQEGGPRNGVLTSVEDFLAESDAALEFVNVPGFAGLGILAPRSLIDSNNDVASLLESLRLSPTMRKYVEEVEAYRMRRR